jgi:acyl-CoA dehydrogenase
LNGGYRSLSLFNGSSFNGPPFNPSLEGLHMGVVLVLGLLLTVVLTLAVQGLSLWRGSLSFMLAWLVIGLWFPLMWSVWLLLPLLLVLALFNSSTWRVRILSTPVYRAMQRMLPDIGDTERAALEAGTTWWEKDLFSGQPNWERFAAIDAPTLTEAERAFLDGDVDELCALLDEWRIYQDCDLPPEVWQFLKQRRFFGLIIPREYGGLEFSPYAQSRVMSKIASRSLTAAVTAMVPNSLGPGELLMKYGTDAQKQRWLPGLADGSEIPCFGLTGPEAGSDAGSIPDRGIVCMGEHDGQTVLGLRLDFDKRWITLAPVATVVGLAFKLSDPDGLLGDPERVDYGITCALLPADHPGVKIGRRHNPGVPFMNGPVSGKGVFIPLDWIIGGVAMAGQGWRMLVECLGMGRGISLPALATASGERSYLAVGAFAAIRRQFGMPIGRFEGVQEATGHIAGAAYTLEAMRMLVTRGLADGAPSVMTAMAKYHATELMRELVNHGMDVVAGRAIQQGPRNFLAVNYQALPIGITVEGANILIRSLMIFGQGAMRCHPYLYEEIAALHDDDAAAVARFDSLLLQHLRHVLANSGRLIARGALRGLGSPAPAGADEFARAWYRRINLYSAALAVGADLALVVLGGDIKRREMLSARLGDLHSQLLIACAVLKYRSVQGSGPAQDRHAEYALHMAFARAERALLGFCRNFPVRSFGLLLRFVALPWGARQHGPSDELQRQLGDLILTDNAVRRDFASKIFISDSWDDALGRVEKTFQMQLSLAAPRARWQRARQRGELGEGPIEAQLERAVERHLIEAAEAPQLLELEQRLYDCILTDAFDKL